MRVDEVGWWEESREEGGREKGNRDSGVQLSPQRVRRNKNKKHDASRDKDMLCSATVKRGVARIEKNVLFVCFYSIGSTRLSDTARLS